MTEETFAASAARLAGLTGALIGWRPAEFWQATPMELAAIMNAMTGEETRSATAADIERLKEIFPDG